MPSPRTRDRHVGSFFVVGSLTSARVNNAYFSDAENRMGRVPVSDAVAKTKDANFALKQ